VEPGDVIAPGPKENSTNVVKESLELNKGREAPSWMQVEDTPPSIKVAGLPNRAEAGAPVEEQLVVEFCSK
ncbi:MAG: 30S ribosomal protein S4, partial [Planctomycetota bacterium]|jgi:ribosomal protein S4